MDGGEEVACGLVIASGDGTELLELGKAALDGVALAVARGVEARRADVRCVFKLKRQFP